MNRSEYDSQQWEVISNFPNHLNYELVRESLGKVNSNWVKHVAKQLIEGSFLTKEETKEVEDLRFKIINFITSDGSVPQHILESRIIDKAQDILVSSDWQQVFRKPPIKQNTMEKCFEFYLCNTVIPNLYDWDYDRPSRLYFIDGVMIHRKPERDKYKSVDFNIYLPDGKIYHLFHKYIKGNGGNQDTTVIEVLNSITGCENNKDRLRRFVFVCDGSRWEADLEEYKHDREKANIIICTTPEVKNRLSSDSELW